MEIGNMKNIVVLKNLPSNMVEEAFIILKPNMKIREANWIRNEKKTKAKTDSKNKDAKEYVIREAEMLVSNYISSIEKPKESKKIKNIEKKYKRLKNVTGLLAAISIIGMLVSLL